MEDWTTDGLPSGKSKLYYTLLTPVIEESKKICLPNSMRSLIPAYESEICELLDIVINLLEKTKSQKDFCYDLYAQLYSYCVYICMTDEGDEEKDTFSLLLCNVAETCTQILKSNFLDDMKRDNGNDYYNPDKFDKVVYAIFRIILKLELVWDFIEINEWLREKKKLKKNRQGSI